MRQQMRTTASFALALSIWVQSIGCSFFSDAYPLVMELPPKQETCMRFTLPDDDDAHMIFAAVPAKVDEKVESWMVTEMNQATDKDTQVLSETMARPPADIQKMIETASKDLPGKSDVFFRVQLAGGSRRVVKTQIIPFFQFVSFEHMAGGMDGQDERKNKSWDPDLGTYNVCFQNYHNNEVRGIFDVVMLSAIQDKHRRKKLLKKEHFTPLQEIYEHSLQIGQTILDEMLHMEAREHLMQHKSDTTSNKVRFFSVFSICVLVGVTWLQITYLKSYFKKKKVL
mmetsp:Transcript_6417/g.6021  ORF Transcript_6417/g.6021 Transcript_6417/m.6021 type:complete len:283 (-) Transcript_6417:304-1152(-)|eukprot:CAMPEP_0197835854 /NCGR_PEP_ID=MMETSP1437-20131217/27150_1 /TAXON_ID=49252 ORGANISM="Eucampia antarctica, Strain CCMP1452" /NCGR_SAMPLE_ID=MMETSP1437 /ASSEMBLY_ACC=CAM_ASM_001096 /LENGTH=282 /DNA_ID=CAMNT_0043441571 /DNA_START=93 /DNA_END=941 /DNA_ORIENTATION=+